MQSKEERIVLRSLSKAYTHSSQKYTIHPRLRCKYSQKGNREYRCVCKCQENLPQTFSVQINSASM